VPEVVIVGGGIIGAACAHELALRGFGVTLFEAHELAHGASGRNLGLVDLPKDPVLDALARASIERYLEVSEDPPFPFAFDREPIGTLSVALTDDDIEFVLEEGAAAERSGIAVERLEGAALREVEPGLTPDAKLALRFRDGRRVDPGGLTVCLAELARRHGATIRHHTPVRRLMTEGNAVTGVVTDDGVVGADTVLLAAGPWSSSFVRPLGIALRVEGARGWIVQMAPGSLPIRHWIEGAARTMWRMQVEPVPAGAFAADEVPFDVGSVIQPSQDGTVVAGTSREAALTPEPFGLDVGRLVASAAIRLIPALAEAPVIATWSGVRPMSPDERPLIGWLRPGLFAVTGHGSEGVILGGGTAAMVGAMLAGEPPPFDPAPFDPLRFG
jgi:glycine/D-amino acid oxidase-like deaminating enzyme